ncbi:unnamed protein product [Miscanthus lutarioriparius]|uniref:Uncharacterized protein n=1 Tax=Miscanthus lutarioriparius TaxID=422564 RepID=A0A811QY84_9POAL|nr:unnamed protein product [Miscanthus lutarioriparius]
MPKYVRPEKPNRVFVEGMGIWDGTIPIGEVFDARRAGSGPSPIGNIRQIRGHARPLKSRGRGSSRFTPSSSDLTRVSGEDAGASVRDGRATAAPSPSTSQWQRLLPCRARGDGSSYAEISTDAGGGSRTELAVVSYGAWTFGAAMTSDRGAWGRGGGTAIPPLAGAGGRGGTAHPSLAALLSRTHTREDERSLR